jgi:phosphogluconate dehydratase
LAKVCDGDLILLNSLTGELRVLLSDADWAARPVAEMPQTLRDSNALGMGRELFSGMRRQAVSAEEGAMSWL